MEQSSIKEIRLAADIQTDSIVDGPGLRAVIWTQGCAHNCKGCHNPGTHDFNGGGLIPIDLVLDEIDKLEYQKGITISGGDPMYQPDACNVIAEYARNKGLDVWVYTGFTFEELLKMSETKPIYRRFLENIDVLVDGKFILEERDLNLLFRGSRNQRLIDVPLSLEKGSVVLVNEVEYENKDKRFSTYKTSPMFV